MTGERIAYVRKALGLSRYAFAKVLAVAVSTVYRWEAEVSCRPEGLAGALLLQAWSRLNRSGGRAAAKVAAAAIEDALLARDELRAIGAFVAFAAGSARRDPI